MWGNWKDVQLVSSGLYSSTSFDKNEAAFYLCLPKVAGMVWSLLWRLYLFVLVSALALNAMTRKYRALRVKLPYGWMKSALATLVLPRVSEWHVLLSDMLLPLDDVSLVVDVLTKNGTLYQGRVQDRMLGVDGTLQTLTMSDPKRFQREDFKRAKDADQSTKVEAFWRTIPGKLFVIMGSDIVNLNVLYLPKVSETRTLSHGLTEVELQGLRNLLSKLKAPQLKPIKEDNAGN